MTFTEHFVSHLQGPHKHCFCGVLAIGATLLASSFLGDTTELALGLVTLTAVALYASRNPRVPEGSTAS